MFPPGFGDATGWNYYRCGHNLLLSHAKAYRLYESKFRPDQGGQVSITINAFWGEPKNAWDQKDIDAAQEMSESFGKFSSNNVIHFRTIIGIS